MDKVPKFTIVWWWIPISVYNNRIRILRIPYLVTVYLNINGWEITNG